MLMHQHQSTTCEIVSPRQEVEGGGGEDPSLKISIKVLILRRHWGRVKAIVEWKAEMRNERFNIFIREIVILVFNDEPAHHFPVLRTRNDRLRPGHLNGFWYRAFKSDFEAFSVFSIVPQFMIPIVNDAPFLVRSSEARRDVQRIFK